MRFISLHAGKVNILARIGRQQVRFHSFCQRLAKNVLVQTQTAGRQATLTILTPAGSLFIYVGLQMVAGYIL